MRAITNRQLDVLRFIAKHIRDHGFAPAHRDITSHFGWTSTHAAFCHLVYLEKKGALRTSSGPGFARRSRTTQLTELGWELSGVDRGKESPARVFIGPRYCGKCGATTFNSDAPCVICRLNKEAAA